MAATPKCRIEPCGEKQRLRVLYSQAVEANSGAVDQVLQARGKAPKEEYELLRAQGDAARRAVNFARTALEQHKHEHGC